jgi:predicted fused transcriptional regulator/phosphomethylpyrimidine kinase
MTQEQIKTIQELKDQGYAVVLFNPDELEGAEADRVEDRLIEMGWDVIYDLKPETEEVREILMALHNARKETGDGSNE